MSLKFTMKGFISCHCENCCETCEGSVRHKLLNGTGDLDIFGTIAAVFGHQILAWLGIFMLFSVLSTSKCFGQISTKSLHCVSGVITLPPFWTGRIHCTLSPPPTYLMVCWVTVSGKGKRSKVGPMNLI